LCCCCSCNLFSFVFDFHLGFSRKFLWVGCDVCVFFNAACGFVVLCDEFVLRRSRDESSERDITDPPGPHQLGSLEEALLSG
jgi:hypothetical protein